MRHISVMAEKSRDDDRRKRLAKQLRANLARRKAQVRARRAGDADTRNEGLPAAEKTSNSPNKDGGEGC